MARILVPLPSAGFDPSETGIPWRILTALNHTLHFATPDGTPGIADPRMVTGQDLGLLAPILRADAHGLAAYHAMLDSAEFQRPLPYAELAAIDFDALLLPGGHAKAMRPYLESRLLQALVAEFFAGAKPVGAICHGVVLAARARAASGRSVLYGRKTTALLRSQELLAWGLTGLYLGNYYRTYKTTVQGEVTAALAAPADFLTGPSGLSRDTPDRPNGFSVTDGDYVSAR
jgi:protease I